MAFQKEALNNSKLQPYNAHIPYILQFFVDFSIFGMDFIHFSKIYKRINSFNLSKTDLIDRYFLFYDYRLLLLLFRSPLKPVTNMQLEFDVFSDNILNPEKKCKILKFYIEKFAFFRQLSKSRLRIYMERRKETL